MSSNLQSNELQPRFGLAGLAEATLITVFSFLVLSFCVPARGSMEMRNTNISNSIANVIRRFSGRVNAMLCATTAAPQLQWHLQPFAGSMSGRNSIAIQLLPISVDGSGTLRMDLPGSCLLGMSEPTCHKTSKRALLPLFIQRLFQRLS